MSNEFDSVLEQIVDQTVTDVLPNELLVAPELTADEPKVTVERKRGKKGKKMSFQDFQSMREQMTEQPQTDIPADVLVSSVETVSATVNDGPEQPVAPKRRGRPAGTTPKAPKQRVLPDERKGDKKYLDSGKRGVLVNLPIEQANEFISRAYSAGSNSSRVLLGLVDWYLSLSADELSDFHSRYLSR